MLPYRFLSRLNSRADAVAVWSVPTDRIDWYEVLYPALVPPSSDEQFPEICDRSGAIERDPTTTTATERVSTAVPRAGNGGCR